MSTHTPGPWEETYGKKIYANGRVVAEVMTHEREHEAEDNANARLIAAGPDLLAALSEIINYAGGADSAIDDPYVMDRAVAALNKATGDES